MNKFTLYLLLLISPMACFFADEKTADQVGENGSNLTESVFAYFRFQKGAEFLLSEPLKASAGCLVEALKLVGKDESSRVELFWSGSTKELEFLAVMPLADGGLDKLKIEGTFKSFFANASGTVSKDLFQKFSIKAPVKTVEFNGQLLCGTVPFVDEVVKIGQIPKAGAVTANIPFEDKAPLVGVCAFNRSFNFHFHQLIPYLLKLAKADYSFPSEHLFRGINELNMMHGVSFSYSLNPDKSLEITMATKSADGLAALAETFNQAGTEVWQVTSPSLVVDLFKILKGQGTDLNLSVEDTNLKASLKPADGTLVTAEGMDFVKSAVEDYQGRITAVEPATQVVESPNINPSFPVRDLAKVVNDGLVISATRRPNGKFIEFALKRDFYKHPNLVFCGAELITIEVLDKQKQPLEAAPALKWKLSRLTGLGWHVYNGASEDFKRGAFVKYLIKHELPKRLGATVLTPAKVGTVAKLKNISLKLVQLNGGLASLTFPPDTATKNLFIFAVDKKGRYLKTLETCKNRGQMDVLFAGKIDKIKVIYVEEWAEVQRGGVVPLKKGYSILDDYCTYQEMPLYKAATKLPEQPLNLTFLQYRDDYGLLHWGLLTDLPYDGRFVKFDYLLVIDGLPWQKRRVIRSEKAPDPYSLYGFWFLPLDYLTMNLGAKNPKSIVGTMSMDYLTEIADVKIAEKSGYSGKLGTKKVKLGEPHHDRPVGSPVLFWNDRPEAERLLTVHGFDSKFRPIWVMEDTFFRPFFDKDRNVLTFYKRPAYVQLQYVKKMERKVQNVELVLNADSFKENLKTARQEVAKFKAELAGQTP